MENYKKIPKKRYSIRNLLKGFFKKKKVSMKIGVVFYHKNISQLYPKKWIEECVKSILGQTHQDFAIYELNYGDDNFRLHKEFEIDKEYHYYKNPFDNHAQAMNFILNKAIEDGCDAVFNTNMDDNYSLNRFEIQLEYINKGYDIISSNFVYIDENSVEIREMDFSKIDIAENLEKDHNVIAHPSVCYSKKFLEENLYIPEEIPREDLLLWKRTVNDYRFHICDKILLNYRIHKDQVSRKREEEISETDSIIEVKEARKKSKKHSKKVGLLLIATNKYVEFLDELISTADEYFLKNQEVTYFVFTNEKINLNTDRKVVRIETEHKKWPWMTLGRYEIFQNSSDILSSMDYLYYCDVDMRFVSEVGDEVLGDLVGTLHPGYWNREDGSGTPERNSKSLAYIPVGSKNKYYAGGFNGGTYKRFMKMCFRLDHNIETDHRNNIIAIWHDESHLNKYLFENPPTISLDPGYCYPEDNKAFFQGNSDVPFKAKLIALNKDHNLYRDITDKKVEKNLVVPTQEFEEALRIQEERDRMEKWLKWKRSEPTCSKCGERKDPKRFNSCPKCGQFY
jgi:histo-blood group ABO system transferase